MSRQETRPLNVDKGTKTIKYTRTQQMKQNRNLRRSEFSAANNLGKMSKVGLQAFATKVQDEYETQVDYLEGKVLTEQTRNARLVALLGMAYHPQMNFDLFGMLNEFELTDVVRTDGPAIIFCQDCDARNVLDRLGNGMYWLEDDHTRSCGDCGNDLTDKAVTVGLGSEQETQYMEQLAQKEDTSEDHEIELIEGSAISIEDIDEAKRKIEEEGFSY